MPTIQINRAPVLTLWATIVAERLGYDRDAALTFGKAVADLNAQAKARRLGIVSPRKEGAKKSGLGEESWVDICGRSIPIKNTDQGVRAVVEDKPIVAATVQRYLEQKFGDDLGAVEEAMRALAASFVPKVLEDAAYGLYERFRPEIPSGVRGWGAKGVLGLDLIRSLANAN
jgi:hypothetical protein